MARPSIKPPVAPVEAKDVEARDEVDATRLIDWARGRDPVRWVLGGMVVVWFLVFFSLCKLRHDRFGTFAFDLGTYDQGVWLLAHGKQFVTVRGLNLLGHHMNLILVVLAPFYRLGAGPVFLAFVQVAAQASGAVAVFLLARDRLADRWLAVVLAGVLLLNPTYQFLTWEYFHPDALAIAPLLFSYWAARARRWGWFAVAAVLAVACKEDVALAVAVIGVLIAVRDNRKVGAIAAGLAGAWFLLSTRLLQPAFLPTNAPFYDTFFGDLGNSAGEVVKNAILRPGTVFDLATRPDRLSYYRMMLAPLAFLPLASLSTLMVALPMVAVNVLTTFPYARDYEYHYSALVVAGAMLATVEGIARLGRRPGTRRFLVGVVAACALGTSVAWGVSPVSVKYRQGYWPLAQSPRTAVQQAAVATVPPRAAVSAIYSMVPHLSHRERIYNFPEPWRRVDWGVAGENLHDPGLVQWLVVDRQLLSERDHRLVDRLLASQFTARFETDGILVAERTAPGAPVDVD
ncbi:MAG TPA: DUF2079 domain-containing protein [Acidimicrobiales bacterium]|nr:DUF2079 domain-containing protein [Acidimicrobiales bacterium]